MNQDIDRIRRTMKQKKYKVKTSEKNHYIAHFPLTKLLCTIILTLLCLIGLRKSVELKKIFNNYVYENNFSFAQVRSLYQSFFGETLPFENMLGSSTKPVFNEKFLFSAREEYLEGNKFFVTKQYLMPILESGMVVFIGDKEGYGNTIIVQQVNGVDTWYSNVSSNVKLYDYVEKGDVLGEVQGDFLYLTFKKDGTSVGYEEYI